MKMFNAYKNIMDRLNLTYKIVKADTGAMGGSLSEEFGQLHQLEKMWLLDVKAVISPAIWKLQK